MEQTESAAPSIDGCIVACARTLDAVGQFERAGGEYAIIGPHLRHCLDHVMCFLRGLHSGVIEYDARDRDPLVETNAAYYRDKLNRAMEQLAAIPPASVSDPICVRQMAAPGVGPATVRSTVERELLFLSSHTIHHIATVSRLAKDAGITLSDDLSLAFSTAAYRASIASSSHSG